MPLRFGGMSEFLRSRRDGVEMRSDGDHFSVDLAGDISSAEVRCQASDYGNCLIIVMELRFLRYIQQQPFFSLVVISASVTHDKFFE